MKRKGAGSILLLALGLSAAVLSVAGMYNKPLAIVGGILIAGITVLQYRLTGPYVQHFTVSDWKSVNNHHELIIAKHDKGIYPHTAVYVRTGNELTEVFCDIETLPTGAVRLGITSAPFEGEVRIS